MFKGLRLLRVRGNLSFTRRVKFSLSNKCSILYWLKAIVYFSSPIYLYNRSGRLQKEFYTYYLLPFYNQSIKGGVK